MRGRPRPPSCTKGTMPAVSKNSNDRMLERIEAVLNDVGARTDRYGPDDIAVLVYIRNQITEAGLARRGEDDQNVSHLLDVAKMRLAPYEEANANAKQRRN